MVTKTFMALCNICSCVTVWIDITGDCFDVWQENLWTAEQMAQEQKEKLLRDYKVLPSSDELISSL